MSRQDATAAFLTAIGTGQSVIRPVLIGRLEIDSDPIRAWTGVGTFAPSGSGDAALDGYTFDPINPYLEISKISEGWAGAGPVSITLQGNDLDDPALRQVVRDRRAWRGKKAYLWLGLLDSDLGVINYPVRIKTGVMTRMLTTRDGRTSYVAVTIDSDIGRADSAPFRILDHVRFFPSDTFSTYLVKLSNKPNGFDNQSKREVRGGGIRRRFVDEL